MVCGERSHESHSLPVKARGELCGVKKNTDFYVVKMDVDKNGKQHWPLFVGGEEICFSRRHTLWLPIRRCLWFITSLEPCCSMLLPSLQHSYEHAAICKASCNVMLSPLPFTCFSMTLTVQTRKMWRPLACFECLEKAQPPEGPSTSSNSSFPESVNINHTTPNFSAFVNDRPDSRMIYQLELWAIRVDFSASGGLQWVV